MSDDSSSTGAFQNSYGSFLVPEEFQEIRPLDNAEARSVQVCKSVFGSGSLSFEQLGRFFDEKYQEIRREMILLAEQFYKEFPYVSGLKNAYGLNLLYCGKSCILCPHSIKWRKFDCIRKNPHLDTVERAIQGQAAPDLRLYTASIQSTTSVQSEFLVSHERQGKSRHRNHPGRRTVVLQHGKRHGSLPSSYLNKLKQKEKKYYERFRWYNEEVKRLNKARAKLGEIKKELGHMYRSVTTSKKFKSNV